MASAVLFERRAQMLHRKQTVERCSAMANVYFDCDREPYSVLVTLPVPMSEQQFDLDHWQLAAQLMSPAMHSTIQ
jgi:hypothetical protein